MSLVSTNIDAKVLGQIEMSGLTGAIEEKYHNLPEWARWILCWPLSLITAALLAWTIVWVNSEYFSSFAIGVLHPPLAHGIFLWCIYVTVPRAKLVVLLTFIILRSLCLMFFTISAIVTLLEIKDLVTFDTEFWRATLGEVNVLIVSIVLWKGLYRMRNADKKDEGVCRLVDIA